jgi:osmotically-inducible protein OsmY
VQSIGENPGAYRSRRELLNDPLADALLERGLTDAVKMLVGIVSAENSGKAALSLARKQDALGQPIAALAYAQEAVDEFHQDNSVPLESEARILLSGIQMKAGNVAQAEASLSRVLLKIDSLSDQQKGQALALSGNIAVEKGDSLTAYKNYSNAVTYFVESKAYGSAALALHNVAYMKLKEGNVDEAQNDLDQAIELYAKGKNRTGESETLYKLAVIQEANGQSERRQKTLLRYLALFPDGAHAGEAATVLPDWKEKMDLKEDSNRAMFASSSNDSKIENAAKASYNYSTVLNDRVSVKSNEGVVTLTGTVQDRDDKVLAQDTVENLPGVVSVDNQIVVKSEVPEHSDAWIAMKIRGELLVKANVSTTATKVNVKDGYVTLTGTADNLSQKERTETYAKDIDGVKSVRNEIVVAAPGANSATVGEVIDDPSITSEIKFALLSHASTSALSTEVTTENGVVRISGVAGSNAEKDLVTKLAQDTRGVKSVVNDMTVKS